MKVNQINSYSQTFLMAACEQGSTSLIAFLIESGANIDMSDKGKNTALHYAVESHKTDAVAFLVSSGANVNKQDSEGDTPLHRAVVNKYEDVVKVLLNSKENNNLQVNLQNNEGWTALHLPCLYRQTNIVELLLQQNGIDVNAVTENGWTALHFACQGGQTNIVELLLQHNGIDVNAVTKYGSTPLHIASIHEHKEVIELLLQQNGIDANKVNEFGNTPLHWAVQNQDYDVVASMLAQDGNNCLHIAAEKEEFCSEKEHITILDECCAKLGLPIEKRLSGVGVAGYLAHQGANLYRKNNKNVSPLDLIGDADLKEKFKKLLLPQKCMLCEVNEASMELQPCAHTVLCEDCSKIQLKRCPKCKTCIESKRRVGRELGIDQTDLEIIKENNPLNVVEQGFQMLLKWWRSTDPEKHTLQILKEALVRTECYDALKCLSSEFN
ncbi:E3 ubiquitin-protein ligase MIB2-like isoform X14 [Octopus vulgaris]|uniref:E3 ubiquitin-protein ligase MIB2-like isoform X14 n=1 Tax=Octopus vulgaris TaxID=6645 RepID=A0AA36FLY3_OCTVU|nr:E3 ubiquitin-protein ligase MIB2-like isoform X14 [Octopus vulgaris]